MHVHHSVRRTLSLIVAMLVTVLLQACAGWSSFDGGKRPSHSTAHARNPVPATPADGSQYRVQGGDTLYSIAFRNNLDYRELARWNGIGSDYLIRNGQLLRLTAPGGRAPASMATIATPPRSAAPSAALPAKPVVAAGAPPSVAAVASTAVPEPATAAVPASSATTEMPEIGNYDWAWPTLGAISRGFAQQGSKGLDFSGQEGQPVFAAASGRVVYSGNALKGYGELIIIKHDETYLSAYGYNRRRNVREGDIVTVGQPIAEMGLGPESRPLLHFEIRERGQPINPASKLPARAAIR